MSSEPKTVAGMSTATTFSLTHGSTVNLLITLSAAGIGAWFAKNRLWASCDPKDCGSPNPADCALSSAA